MKRLVILIAVATLAVTSTGCQSARYVYRDRDTGVVAMARNTEKHREKALALMQQHFPEGYVVLDEGEYVTGQRTTVNSDSISPGGCDDRGGFGYVSTTSTATTRDTKEWRIRYQRDPNATGIMQASATSEIQSRR